MTKARAYGVRSKNKEQEEALLALLNPSIDLVVLSGKAGSGKTLLALAAGLEQTMESKTYTGVMFTRAPVAVGSDLGFLPGDVNEKMAPWCGGLADNLEYLNVHPKDAERYISIVAMQHMRGRSLHRKYLILDELQNISKEELKVLLTRAGEDTKIICMGDASQVDNKRLSKDNNALQYLISKANVDFVKVIELPDGVDRVCALGQRIRCK